MDSVIKIRTANLSRQAWLKERQKGIGGSDAAAIAGLNPYKTPLEVYFEKTGAKKNDSASESAYWGQVLEDVVAREFSKRTGFKIRRKNAILQHKDYPWMIADIDREFWDVKGQEKGVLECKTSNEFFKKQWQEDQIPDAYMLQVQHYLAVTGYPIAYMACLIGGNRFVYKKIPRDEEMIRYLIQIEQAFWEKVENQTPPDWSGKGKEEELLEKMYPPEDLTQETIQLNAQEEDLVRDYAEIVAICAENERKKKELLTRIKAMMKNYTLGSGQNYEVACKSYETTRLDVSKIKSDGLFGQYGKTTTVKKYTVRERKEG